MQKRKITRIFYQLRQSGDKCGITEFKRIRAAFLCFALAILISSAAQPHVFANAPAFTVTPGNSGVKTQIVSSDVVGASLEIPAEWQIEQDPFLFDTFGFVLFDPDGEKIGGHARSPVMRVALAPQVKPGQIENLIKNLIEKNKEFNLIRAEVHVGGLKGIAISGLPGTDSFSLVYAAADAGAADGYADGQYDLKLSDGTKYYTRFYHGRWMRN